MSPRVLVYLAAAVFCHAACIWLSPLRYVVAGQSNALGASTQPTPLVTGIGRSFGHDNVWRDANDPTIHFPNETWRHSAWPEFILERFDQTGRRTELVATAQGGRCLVYPNATSGEDPPWRPSDGGAYADMIAYVAASGWTAPPKAVLWFQGECDAHAWWSNPAIDSQEAHDAYLTGLLDLAEAIERDLGVPLVVAPVSLKWCRWDNPGCDPALFKVSSQKRLPIHDATIQAALVHPGIFLGALSDDLRHEPDDGHIHDVNELGRRWAAAFEAAGL